MPRDLDATRHGGDDVARELHALGAHIVSLQTEVRRLQSAALPRDGAAGWDDAPPAPASLASFGWISRLEPPRRRAVRIPRLPFELAFLAGAASLAGFAHLRPLVIAAVMGGAWAIVALAEWAGSRGDRLRHQLLLEAPSRTREPETRGADPAWFTPPVEHTLLSRATSSGAPKPPPPDREAPEPETIVAVLPVPPEAENTAERQPGS